MSTSDNGGAGQLRTKVHFREVGELTEAELSRFTPAQKRRIAALNEVDRRLDWLLASVGACKAAQSGKPFEHALAYLTDALLEYHAALEAREGELPDGAEPGEYPGNDQSGRARAIGLGRLRNQVSIWDNAAEVAIPTGGTGEFLPDVG